MLTADLASADPTSEARERHPARFLDFGIAETNRVAAAAGMAACGRVPLAVAFASFLGIPCAERTRTDRAHPGLPMRPIGTHSGIAMGFYGTSHRASEDLATMCADARPTAVCASLPRASLDHPGAIRVRLGRGRDSRSISSRLRVSLRPSDPPSRGVRPRADRHGERPRRVPARRSGAFRACRASPTRPPTAWAPGG